MDVPSMLGSHSVLYSDIESMSQYSILRRSRFLVAVVLYR